MTYMAKTERKHTRLCSLSYVTLFYGRIQGVMISNEVNSMEFTVSIYCMSLNPIFIAM